MLISYECLNVCSVDNSTTILPPVKFRGKIPVNFEYENNKQKMEFLITERTDITPLLGMDWMKTFKLTIGRIQLAENNQ